MKSHYQYSKESVTMGETYKKQIILMGNMQDTALKLWNSFLSKQKNIEKEVITNFKRNHYVDVGSFINSLYDHYQKNIHMFPKIELKEFEQENSKLWRALRGFSINILLKSGPKTASAIDYLKQLGSKDFCQNDWYKRYTKITPSFKTSDSNKTADEEPHPIQQLNNFIKEQKSIQNPEEDSIINFQKTKTDQTNTKKQKTVKINIQNKEEKDDEADPKQTDLKILVNTIREERNESSDRIKKDTIDVQSTTTIINPIKRLIQPSYMHLDNFNPFPQIEIQEEILKKDLNNYQNQNQDFNLNLIAEVIVILASGVQLDRKLITKNAFGESLHVMTQQINRVMAYKIDPVKQFLPAFYNINLSFFQSKKKEIINRFVLLFKGCCLSIRRLLKQDYQPIGLAGNSLLPKWLNCDIIDGTINIWGVPGIYDDTNIQIRIINQTGFVVLSYILEIKEAEDDAEAMKNFNERQFQSRKMTEQFTSFNLDSLKEKSQRIIKPILLQKVCSTEGNNKDQTKFSDNHLFPQYQSNQDKQLTVNWEKLKSLNRSSFHKLELETSKKDTFNQGIDSFHFEIDKQEELESSIQVNL